MPEAEEEEEKATMCMRVADLLTPIEGSRQIDCTNCGAKCWISPATLEASAMMGISNIWCFPCAFALISKDEEVKWLN